MAYRHFVLVCGGKACESPGSEAIYRGFLLECEEQGIKAEVEVVRTGCLAFCSKGPVVKVLPDEALYVGVQAGDIKEIVTEHLVKGAPVQRLLYDWQDSRRQARVDGIDFYQKQFRIVLRNCGVIDPDRIEEYIARDGYVALERALFDLTPDQVLDEIKKSGLRGRGGAGFPTWLKWKLTKDVSSDVRYVVCNADEGDPGAYMNRSTLEGDPHSILEAMTICGRTVGASQGTIYIRAEYPLAIRRLENAIAQARAMGLLGRNILGSGFDVDIELRLGAGAFVCGEETALLASIEATAACPCRGLRSPRCAGCGASPPSSTMSRPGPTSP
jgi:(2Fe-2S) ferredoxin